MAAALGRRFGPRVGAYAALFQGIVGLPLGLALTALAARAARPEDATLGPLSLYLSMGQLLVLPLAIVLIVRARYAVTVALLAVTLAVHFVPYSWLYRTPIYLGVGAVIAVGTAALVVARTEARQVWSVCAVTGSALIVGGAAALVT